MERRERQEHNMRAVNLPLELTYRWTEPEKNPVRVTSRDVSNIEFRYESHAEFLCVTIKNVLRHDTHESYIRVAMRKGTQSGMKVAYSASIEFTVEEFLWIVKKINTSSGHSHHEYRNLWISDFTDDFTGADILVGPKGKDQSTTHRLSLSDLDVRTLHMNRDFFEWELLMLTLKNNSLESAVGLLSMKDSPEIKRVTKDTPKANNTWTTITPEELRERNGETKKKEIPATVPKATPPLPVPAKSVVHDVTGCPGPQLAVRRSMEIKIKESVE
jgi:hypothetical protein